MSGSQTDFVSGLIEQLQELKYDRIPHILEKSFNFDEMAVTWDTLTRLFIVSDRPIRNYIFHDDWASVIPDEVLADAGEGDWDDEGNWIPPGDEFSKVDYMGLILQVAPSHLDFSDGGMSLTHRAVIADLGTGMTVADVANEIALQSGSFTVVTRHRSEVKQLLGFLSLAEGRYRSFQMSNMMQAFEPVTMSPAVFPNIENESILSDHFYALNWGQKTEMYYGTNRRIWIFVDGYRMCIWNRIEKIEPTPDPRIIRVQFGYPMPHIDIHDIDLITDTIFARQASDEADIEFTTTSVTATTITYHEDPEVIPIRHAPSYCDPPKEDFGE